MQADNGGRTIPCSHEYKYGPDPYNPIGCLSSRFLLLYTVGRWILTSPIYLPTV